MRCALVEIATGKVANIVEVVDGDGSTIPPGFTLVATNVASPDDSYAPPAKTYTRQVKDPTGKTQNIVPMALVETAPIAAFLATLPVTKP